MLVERFKSKKLLNVKQVIDVKWYIRIKFQHSPSSLFLWFLEGRHVIKLNFKWIIIQEGMPIEKPAWE